MNKVLLINSPLYAESTDNNESYLPPMGLLYLMEALEQNEISVDFIDCVNDKLSVNDIAGRINAGGYNYIGINIFSPNYLLVKELVESVNTESDIIIGGQIVKAVYEDIIKWTFNNRIIIVIGEAERIISDIINEKVSEKPIIDNANRIVYEITSKSVYYPFNISEIHLNKSILRNYYVKNKYGLLESYIIASRGCIYSCAFCGSARKNNLCTTVRYCTPEYLADEIREFVNDGVQCIRILDDLLLVDREHIINAIQIFKEFNIKWRAMAHVKTFSDNFDLLEQLYECGCIELSIGIESGDDGIRKFINKLGSVKQIADTIKEILANKINVKGYFIYGFPDETHVQMQETFKLAQYLHRISSKDAVFTGSVFEFRPYHGTELYNYIEQKHGSVDEITFNGELSCLDNRAQFNFKSKNYSQVSENEINKFIIETARLNSIYKIRLCKKCSLHQNQPPLIDFYKTCEVMWVGLSAKKVGDTINGIPLDINTATGELVSEVEAGFRNVNFYKSNIVKCVPLDKANELRYPTKKEIYSCFDNLLSEIQYVKPKLVFLLGSQVTEAIEKHYSIKFAKLSGYDFESCLIDDITYVSIYHPSYINIYRRNHRTQYIDSLKRKITETLGISDVKENSQITLFDIIE